MGDFQSCGLHLPSIVLFFVSIRVRCLSLLVVACRCLSLLVVACRCLSLLVVACRCLSLLFVAFRCLSLLVLACPCLSLLFAALSPPPFRITTWKEWHTRHKDNETRKEHDRCGSKQRWRFKIKWRPITHSSFSSELCMCMMRQNECSFLYTYPLIRTKYL
jgi:hypothetical protein